MKKTTLALLVLVVAATVPAAAQSIVSESERLAVRGVPDRWGVDLGSYWQTFDAKVRLDASNGETGTEINLEEDLRLPESQTNFRVGGYYRFGDHARLDVAYFSWDRSRSTTLERQVEWGDVTYDVGVELEAEASAQALNVVYKYSFVNNGKVTFGLNGGISALWTEFTLSGEGSVNGEPVSGTVTEKKDVIFPVPVLGLHFEMALAKRLLWTVDGDFFVATISGYDGNLTSGGTTIAYYFTPNIGVGAGFATTAYKVNKEGDNGGELRVRYGYGGPVAYASIRF